MVVRGSDERGCPVTFGSFRIGYRIAARKGRPDRSGDGPSFRRERNHPDGYTAEAVRAALADTVQRLPEHLWQSLTWDQGKEMAQHAQFTVATGVQVYFCDPKSPWQRGSNENTNGLLRQYFPKGTDMSALTQADLDAAAHSLNGRPRQTLGWMTPSDKLAEALQ